MPRTKTTSKSPLPPMATAARVGRAAGWTFLSNHAHVLICLSKDPELRMRDLAAHIGITERAVQKIVSELMASGYLEAVREGRRNRYAVIDHHPLRHPVEAHRTVRDLLAVVR